uniref:NmrA-like domain-containing protein n=1 Tax=Salix viminalis TaxID=40686 RepID=A0A6N2MSH7_SALVM
MENELSKILIFGGTGYIGKYMVKASVSMGHKTYVYARPITTQSSPAKIGIHKEFQAMGVTIVQGDIDEQEKIVSVLRQVDVVICTLAYPQVLDQLKIIEAMKVAGNIKRFFPSDFGAEEDRVAPLPPFEAFLDKKRKIRRATEAAGIPHTFVSANCFGAYFVNYLLHPHEKTQDIALRVRNIYFIHHPYCVNKNPSSLYQYRPQKNIVSQLELISLWEKKTGKTFNRIHVPEEEIIVELSKTLPHPQNIPPSILHSLFIKGDLMGFELGEDEVEASTLYPDLQFKTIDQLLDIFLISPPDPAMAAFE